MTYIPALSGLRALACIAVLAFHTRLTGGGGGFLGVDVFFVLSGYLTVGILNRYGADMTRNDALRFMERRVRRILPLLVVVCVTVCGGLWITGQSEQISYEFFSPIGFYSNFAITWFEGPSYLEHGWSLSAEMQFYAFTAGLFLLVARNYRAILLPLFVAIFLAMTMGRYFAFSSGLRWTEIYYAPHLHTSGLFLGGVIALLPARVLHIFRHLGWPALTILVLGVTQAVFLSAMSFTIWSTTAEIAAAVLIMALLSNRDSHVSRFLGRKHLEVLGLWSYGIYLWHFPIAKLLRDEMHELTAFALTLALSVGFAALTYMFIEQRFMAKTKKATPHKAPPSIQPAQ